MTRWEHAIEISDLAGQLGVGGGAPVDRFTVPISSNGDTVELHAWYDQVLFPDTSPMADPEAGPGK